jgi:uncharacterized protein YbaA (DUF1428 family)
MARYVDGFVLPLPKTNLKAYRSIAKKACKIWMDHGALDYVECVLDDNENGKMVKFTKAAACKPSETAIFAWIVFKSKADRNKINAKVMKDPRMATIMAGMKKPPFDCNRITYGGFKAVVEA